MSDQKMQDFCKELATNPTAIGEFLMDPDSKLGDFTNEEKVKLKAIVSQKIHEKLSEHNKPEACVAVM